MSGTVMILMGSKNDWETLQEAGRELDRLGLAWSAHVASAHRSLNRTVDLVRGAEAEGTRVFICGAGMAAHLAGFAAAYTTLPVIGVPLEGSALGGVDALYSTVQMPAGIPVATVAIGSAGAKNAAVLAAEILALNDDGLRRKLAEFRNNGAKF